MHIYNKKLILEKEESLVCATMKDQYDKMHKHHN